MKKESKLPKTRGRVDSPVDDEDYQVPFTFTGKLDKLTLTIDRPQLSLEDVKKLTEMGRSNRASE